MRVDPTQGSKGLGSSEGEAGGAGGAGALGLSERLFEPLERVRCAVICTV